MTGYSAHTSPRLGSRRATGGLTESPGPNLNWLPRLPAPGWAAAEQGRATVRAGLRGPHQGDLVLAVPGAAHRRPPARTADKARKRRPAFGPDAHPSVAGPCAPRPRGRTPIPREACELRPAMTGYSSHTSPRLGSRRATGGLPESPGPNLRLPAPGWAAPGPGRVRVRARTCGHLVLAVPGAARRRRPAINNAGTPAVPRRSATRRCRCGRTGGRRDPSRPRRRG